MSNYTKSVNFTAKDSLTSGDPSKIVYGSELDTEYTAISTAIATKSDDSAVVHDTGTETVAGDKTFSGANKHIGSNTFQGAVNAIAGGGTANAITATFSPTITALVDKMRVIVRATTANTAATTFDPGTGPVLVEKVEAGIRATLAAGDITGDSHDLDLVWNATAGRWILLNPRPATPFSQHPASSYASPANQTPVASSTLTFAHGLGAVPVLFFAVLIAGSAAEHGYATGDAVTFTANNAGNNERSSALYADATNVYIVIDTALSITSATTRASANITLNDSTKWQVTVRAWK